MPEFEKDFENVIKSAQFSGLIKLLVPGIDLPTSQRAVNLANAYPGLLYAAVGIHPNYSTPFDAELIPDFRRLLLNPSVVAVGEIGLDNYRSFSEPSTQVKTFKLMLDLAAEFDKPVCLHQRDSAGEMLEILDVWIRELEINNPFLIKRAGVFHSFGGEPLISQWARDHHFFLGITGFITNKKAQFLRDQLINLPTQYLLLETDSPYISPEPHRGKRNEPGNIPLIAAAIAEALNMSIENLALKTSENANILFDWQNCS